MSNEERGVIKLYMNKVLFLTIYFREYVDRIKSAIESEMNAKVDVIFCEYQRPGAIWATEKIFGKKFAKRINQQNQNKKFLKISENYYDYILVLVGRGLDCERFKIFMNGQKKAKKILYLWDDIERIDEYQKIKNVFDDIVSFDKFDCIKYNLRFLPLFFCDDYRYINDNKDIDFSCIGTLHTYRESLLARLQDKFPKKKYEWYTILSTSIFHICKCKLLGEEVHDFVKHKELSISESAQISKRSKIVIDMPYLSQKGLSIRTIESLAACSKIITTNKEICNYDFYIPDNVCVIDVNNPIIPDGFLCSEYVEPDKKIVEKYSLNHWIQKLFINAEEQ